MNKKYTDNEFKNKLKEYGYTYIDGEYKNQFSKIKCYDKDGYIVFVQLNKLENRGSKPARFHNSNPYTIYNINHFLFLNKDIGCTECTGTYINSRSKLKFRCKCGNTFITTFDSVRSRKKTRCDFCTGYTKNLTYNEIKNNLNGKGYFLETEEKNFKGITLSDLICHDKNGYKYKVIYDQVMSGIKCQIFSKSNVFVIHNINVYLNKNTNGEYECLSDLYVSEKTPLKILHKKCGRTFENSWKNIGRKRYLNKIGNNKTGAMCPFCEAAQLESTHALVLKQVWCYEHKDTIVEDRSCINKSTNCSLPTDIVNHRLRIAIEIQSWFHDFEDQKKKDKIKRDYWINRGYSFYAIDQRDYTVLEMIQLFFPKYYKIPEYIDFDYSNKINDVEIQRLLNNGYNVPQIANIVGCKKHQIYDAVQYGRITYPENYKRADRTAVVQLNENLEYIKWFDTITQAKKETGCNYISSALLSKTHYSGGYYWLRKKDYDSGNYVIEKTKRGKFKTTSQESKLAS